ncbi:MAG: hypothetical protein JNK45_18770 [Myxococcales bacterium]|nr:hypothetical protein [Myxococcales bacterium]
MNEATTLSSASHGGMLIPFDMFRLSQLAAIFGELFISKARNVLDARLVAVRHEASRILLLRIEGHVVGDDAADFWRGNPELALVTSQAVPHRVLMYWAKPGPVGERREGFLFAQRGQVIASDEATDDAPRPDGAWPVTRLCEQMRLNLDDLAAGFPGSPRVEISLVDASGYNDEQLLMTLVGRDPAAEAASAEGGTPTAAAPAGPGAMRAPAAPGARPASPAPSPRANVEEDAKRRAAEAAAEVVEQRKRAEQLQASLEHVIDPLGVIAVPAAGLGEPDLLRALVIPTIQGDLPPGLPRSLADELQGKRCDIAIAVEFLSEVFVENKPLSRPELQQRATTIELGGRSLQALEVLAPRLGYGTLLSTGKRHAFISRKLDQTLPAEVLLRILDGQG